MIERLSSFAKANAFDGKGPLAVALVTTAHARVRGLPLDPAALLTSKEGQVLGLGRSGVQAVLAQHGITRTLAAEGGRTSRGSIDNMRAYVAFLNECASTGPVDLALVEAFWVDRVRAHFAAKPFLLRADPTLSVRAVVRSLIEQVDARQRASDGSTIVGTVMQHMVGAKLQAAIGNRTEIVHHGANINDAKARGGDFDLGDASIHVTTAPGHGVIEKCRANLDGGRRPIIVTQRQRVTMAEALAEDAGIGTRIEIYEFEQFVSINVQELGGFTSAGRAATLVEIIENYNRIIDLHETEPGLRIELVTGR